MVIVSEALLYLAFSIVLGTLILYVIPEPYRPSIRVPRSVLLLSVAGIAVLSFGPVLKLIIHLGKSYGFWTIFNTVLTSFDMGKAWIYTVILSTLLFLLLFFVDVEKQKPFIYLAFGIVVLLVLSQGWASHTKSIAQWKGLFAHTAHFLAVCVWIGVLFVVGWFAQNKSNWDRFLKWFTPVAIGCVLVTIGSGLLIMLISLQLKDYATAWVLPYGQALLLKHLLILPLLLFAFVNGFLMRRKLRQDQGFNPVPWTRAESILVLMIFGATGALGQQAQPHEIERTLQFVEPSAIFQWFYTNTIEPGIQLTPLLNTLSAVLFILAFLLLLCTVLLFRKQVKPMFAIITSVLFVIVSYAALMLSVS